MSKSDKFAALREARAKGGRLSQWKVSKVHEEADSLATRIRNL